MEVAQFIYLLLNNEKIRQVVETITSKAVLILGRFTPERKAVLDAIREALRRQNYLPILFDFEAPVSRDFTESISTLAHMARFIIADLTEPSSLPKELEAIVPTLVVPVQPVLEGATRPYSMFQDYWKYPWVLRVHHYEGLEGLIASLGDGVIAPAEAKVQELEKTRRAIAEELRKQEPTKLNMPPTDAMARRFYSKLNRQFTSHKSWKWKLREDDRYKMTRPLPPAKTTARRFSGSIFLPRPLPSQALGQYPPLAITPEKSRFRRKWGLILRALKSVLVRR
jgi:hypothetical protein